LNIIDQKKGNIIK